MTGLFADITLGAAIAIGLLMFAGVIFIANMNDPRNAMHPGGRVGRLRDELLVVGPVAPMLAMIAAASFLPDLRDLAWWMPVLMIVAIFGLAASFLVPAIRQARQRVGALRKKAFS